MQKYTLSLCFLALTTVFAMGCPSSGTNGTALPTAGAGAGMFGSSTAGTDPGTAGVGIVDPGPTAGTGVGGTGVAGMFGQAGVGATAGDGSVAGTGVAGTGEAGTGGDDGPGFVRGPEPTSDSASNAGPYKVEKYTSGFKAPVSYLAATIYYPSDADAPFAIVVICPGFTATQSSIAAWGPFFASHGIVTMTIDTKTTGDSVVQRSDEIWEALGGLKDENTRAGGPLEGKIDVMRAGVMGWSMGGGGTWIDASKHPELKSAFTLAGHNSTAGGATSSPNIMVPTFMCAGQNDTPILGGAMSQPVYTSIPETTPKMLYEISGGDHYTCNNPSAAGKALGRYGLSWQKVFLEGDDRYRKFLLEMAPMASDFKTNVK